MSLAGVCDLLHLQPAEQGLGCASNVHAQQWQERDQLAGRLLLGRTVDACSFGLLVASAWLFCVFLFCLACRELLLGTAVCVCWSASCDQSPACVRCPKTQLDLQHTVCLTRAAAVHVMPDLCCAPSNTGLTQLTAISISITASSDALHTG